MSYKEFYKYRVTIYKIMEKIFGRVVKEKLKILILVSYLRKF